MKSLISNKMFKTNSEAISLYFMRPDRHPRRALRYAWLLPATASAEDGLLLLSAHTLKESYDNVFV